MKKSFHIHPYFKKRCNFFKPENWYSTAQVTLLLKLSLSLLHQMFEHEKWPDASSTSTLNCQVYSTKTRFMLNYSFLLLPQIMHDHFASNWINFSPNYGQNETNQKIFANFSKKSLKFILKGWHVDEHAKLFE